MKREGEFRSRILSGAFWSVIGKIAGNFLGLFSTFALVRLLTPVMLGQYYLSLSVATFIGTICQFGLGRTGLRFIAQYNAVGKELRSARILLDTLVVLLVIEIAFGVVYYFGLSKAVSEMFDEEVLHSFAFGIMVWGGFEGLLALPHYFFGDMVHSGKAFSWIQPG